MQKAQEDGEQMIKALEEKHVRELEENRQRLE